MKTVINTLWLLVLSVSLSACASNDSPGYHKELLTDLSTAGIGSNGVHFDMADVSKKFADAFEGHQALTLSDAKGFDLYFKNYLSTAGVFSAEERQAITSVLPYMRNWYVQAGDAGINAADTLNYGAFMLGRSSNGNDMIRAANDANYDNSFKRSAA